MVLSPEESWSARARLLATVPGYESYPLRVTVLNISNSNSLVRKHCPSLIRKENPEVKIEKKSSHNWPWGCSRSFVNVEYVKKISLHKVQETEDRYPHFVRYHGNYTWIVFLFPHQGCGKQYKAEQFTLLQREDHPAPPVLWLAGWAMAPVAGWLAGLSSWWGEVCFIVDRYSAVRNCI